MNIDRAVMLMAGTLVAVGVLLGAFVSGWWLVVPAFVGLNLAQAALTGFCPAARVFGALGLRPGPAFP